MSSYDRIFFLSFTPNSLVIFLFKYIALCYVHTYFLFTVMFYKFPQE